MTPAANTTTGEPPRWRPGLKVFAFVMRAPRPLRWALERAVLGFSTKELVSPRGDRIPFRMKSKVEIANNVMRRAVKETQR